MTYERCCLYGTVNSSCAPYNRFNCDKLTAVNDCTLDVKKHLSELKVGQFYDSVPITEKKIA